MGRISIFVAAILSFSLSLMSSFHSTVGVHSVPVIAYDYLSYFFIGIPILMEMFPKERSMNLQKLNKLILLLGLIILLDNLTLGIIMVLFSMLFFYLGEFFIQFNGKKNS